MALRVAAVGEIVEDCYLDPQGNERRLLGGISANFARSAAAAGAHVTLFSAVGDDPTGKRLLAALPITSAVRVLSGESAEQKIRLSATGERQFCGFRAGVLIDYALTPDEQARIARDFDVVHVPVQPETRHLLEGLRAPAIVADFSIDSAVDGDPAAWCAPYLERLAVAFIGGSKAHLPALLALRTPCTIVLTCGADGAYAIASGVAVHQPTVATHVVDTTGCGDAFAGAFTVAHFTGATSAQALLAGAKRAAEIAARVGAA